MTPDAITAKVASLVGELHPHLPAMTDLQLEAVEAITAKLAAACEQMRAAGVLSSARRLVHRTEQQVRAKYGRHAGQVLAAIRQAPVHHADDLVSVLVRGRGALRAQLDATDDQVVRAALLAALRALDELHAIETHATIRQEITGVSERHGSRFAAHPPPTLTRCTHHRRHLVQLSTNDADPAPTHRPGAMTRRYSPCTGGC